MAASPKYSLFRPWDKVREDEVSANDEIPDPKLKINYLRVDTKCERAENAETSGGNLSVSPSTSASSSSSNGNEVDEEEDSLHKLTSLVDRTILGLPGTDNSKSMGSSSSCSETSVSVPTTVENYFNFPPRSAFVPVCFAHPSTYAVPPFVSHAGVLSQPNFDNAEVMVNQEILARQEHAAFDHFAAAQQGQVVLEEAARILHHHEAMVKQNKKLRPKKFRCPHCDVAFSNNGQLKGHIRIHTGERPFKCDEEGCGKTFTRNEELTRHKRIHSGVRPHACPTCGKCFGRKDHLKKHARTHEMRGPTMYIPPPEPFPFPASRPPLHSFLFVL